MFSANTVFSPHARRHSLSSRFCFVFCSMFLSICLFPCCVLAFARCACEKKQCLTSNSTKSSKIKKSSDIFRPACLAARCLAPPLHGSWRSPEDSDGFWRESARRSRDLGILNSTYLTGPDRIGKICEGAGGAYTGTRGEDLRGRRRRRLTFWVISPKFSQDVP